MQLDLFRAFRDTADFGGILLYYNGPISQDVIAVMAEELKHKFEENEVDSGKARKLFSSFIEMSQNALQYSPEFLFSDGQGIPSEIGIFSGSKEKANAIAFGKKGDRFYIVCGNLIEKQYIPRIRERIEPLLALGTGEIRKMYRQQLHNETHTEQDTISKGAGLGLLTIARDASEPLEYSVTDVVGSPAKNLAYFYLKAIF